MTDLGQGSLAGVRVVELGHVIAGPFCGHLFADHGADVIKVEPPEGDPVRKWGGRYGDIGLYWPLIGRGKRSVTLDLRRPEGPAALRELLADVDVVIENFRPGTLERWGVGWDDLHRAFPRLVLVRLTGYGQTGPLVFLPEAFRSAEAWQFPRPEVALAALHTLDRVAGAWKDGELPGAFMVAARAAGLPWRPAISRTAQTQYRADYKRRFGDQEILLGPHLAWGTTPENALCIYVHLDRDTRTVVVGHVGRHLRDTSNPHL